MFDAAQKQKPKLIALQIPEGLKPRGNDLQNEIEQKTGAQTILFIDPIFGACMLADETAKALGADLLVHFGHNRFYKENIATVYIPVRYTITEHELDQITKKIQTIIAKEKFSSIGLVAVIQTIHHLPNIQQRLAKHKITAVIGKENGFMENGQILGCNYSTAKLIANQVDAIFYIGDGRFHPVGLVIDTNKPVYTINPFTFETKAISNERDQFYKKRLGLIAKSQDAKHFGILVSTEKGQWGIQKALLAKKKIEQSKKTAIILVGGLLKPEYITGIKIDCLVNTACPRIATDDSNNYGVPVLSIYELEFALGNKPLEEFRLENTL
ncbi:MAG: diphthamide biosynthesis enzyme Dph2 [Candidatus Diapherotrites archaeon]|uniref:2-(3-amino-3-carboxypropyl)histidine synthase n=1 Tax=Candidatus Iainarchaeum sp. TaxID=3101447 RepID=A0A8T4L6A2_9ARCH|nr:diphthamide biosynthesis enzyme Dph2 [Candidatus Diapherotrites archaeon]